jgi:hypothetical protein
VRELARCFSGWTCDWSSELGLHNFRFVESGWDSGTKTVFGKTGSYKWDQAYRLCVYHDMHPSFFVTKLWSYFIPTPPSDADRQSLEATYVNNDFQVLPVVRAILMHPSLYEGARMVKPPVVFAAGMLRALRHPIDTADWVWTCDMAGQRLFYPRDVSGWDDSRWLDTSTVWGRWYLAMIAMKDSYVPWGSMGSYNGAETADQALDRALAACGNPRLTDESRASLLDFAGSCLPSGMSSYEQRAFRAERQNALLQMITSVPDAQVA